MKNIAFTFLGTFAVLMFILFGVPIHYGDKAGDGICLETSVESHWGFGVLHDPSYGQGLLGCTRPGPGLKPDLKFSSSLESVEDSR